jgi:hypothetical protein
MEIIEAKPCPKIVAEWERLIELSPDDQYIKNKYFKYLMLIHLSSPTKYILTEEEASFFNQKRNIEGLTC